MKLTSEMLHSAASNYAGWNKHQLALLGISKPEKGWLTKLVGTEIDENTWRKVMVIRGIKSKAQRENILSQADKKTGELTEYDALCAVAIAAIPFGFCDATDNRQPCNSPYCAACNLRKAKNALRKARGNI